MFNKYFISISLATKDTITVASGLTQIFAKYGVCNTLISDRGTEFTSACKAEVCRQLCISQEFTPSYVHHCLGACERSHMTLEERLSFYVNKNSNNWVDFLSSITFSINQSVNAGLGYSPHEIIFGQIPKFPMVTPQITDFDSIPVNARAYVRKHGERLDMIRNEVKSNVVISQENMLERANEKTQPLSISIGDYVYLLHETNGKAQKLQNKYKGPVVVNKYISPHLVILREPQSTKCMTNPVHLNRLKMAYVREPTLKPYFLGKVVTCENNPQVTRDSIETQPVNNEENKSMSEIKMNRDVDLRRSCRNRKPPERYGNPVDLDIILSSDDGIMDEMCYHKIKRILGQKCLDNKNLYLVHFGG